MQELNIPKYEYICKVKINAFFKKKLKLCKLSLTEETTYVTQKQKSLENCNTMSFKLNTIRKKTQIRLKLIKLIKLKKY